MGCVVLWEEGRDSCEGLACCARVKLSQAGQIRGTGVRFGHAAVWGCASEFDAKPTTGKRVTMGSVRVGTLLGEVVVVSRHKCCKGATLDGGRRHAIRISLRDGEAFA